MPLVTRRSCVQGSDLHKYDTNFRRRRHVVLLGLTVVHKHRGRVVLEAVNGKRQGAVEGIYLDPMHRVSLSQRLTELPLVYSSLVSLDGFPFAFSPSMSERLVVTGHGLSRAILLLGSFLPRWRHDRPYSPPLSTNRVYRGLGFFYSLSWVDDFCVALPWPENGFGHWKGC